MSEKERIKISDTGKDPDMVRTSGMVQDDIEIKIYELVDSYIKGLNNPDDIYDNNGLFVGMLKYIYKYYLSILLGNNNGVNNRYDYTLLDKLFNIYTSLVYEYKKNKQPYINEFCIFLNINRESLYRVRYENVQKVTPIEIQNVKRWFHECEQALLNTDTVGSIFRLKSMYGYNDNLQAVPIELQANVVSVDSLPDLSSQKMITQDTRKDTD